MDTQPEFTAKDLLSHVIGDVTKAVRDRAGESKAAQIARTHAAAHAVLGFQPRDVVESMLAGHCLMLHEMMVDSVHVTLRGEHVGQQRVTRSGIVAMDKAFGENLARLRHYQARWARTDPAPRSAEQLGETDMADRVRRHQSPMPSPPDTRPELSARPDEGLEETVIADLMRQPEPPPPAASQPEPAAPASVSPALETPASPGAISLRPGPSAEAIAACRANPEAMAALDAGDPVRFAKAMGIDVPAEAYIAAASGPMASMARHPAGHHPPAAPTRDSAIRFAGNRHARRHPNP